MLSRRIWERIFYGASEHREQKKRKERIDGRLNTKENKINS